MGGGEWKVAYADFTTAMMAFFLLMWLLNATTEEQKHGIAGYFTASGSYKDTSTPADISNNNLVQIVDTDTLKNEYRLDESEKTYYAIHQELKNYFLQDAKPSEKSGLDADGLGVLLKVTNGLMFKPGTIEFTEDGFDILNEVILMMSKYKVYLVIRGYVDKAEPPDPYATRWALSAARANAAVRYLVANGVDEGMLLSVAYADTRPLVSEDSPDALQKNSRVEFSFHRPDTMSKIVAY